MVVLLGIKDVIEALNLEDQEHCISVKNLEDHSILIIVFVKKDWVICCRVKAHIGVGIPHKGVVLKVVEDGFIEVNHLPLELGNLLKNGIIAVKLFRYISFVKAVLF